MADIHEVLGSPGFLAMGHRNDALGCLVEQSVNAALSAVCVETEVLLMKPLKAVTLPALSADFYRRMVMGQAHQVGDRT